MGHAAHFTAHFCGIPAMPWDNPWQEAGQLALDIPASHLLRSFSPSKPWPAHLFEGLNLSIIHDGIHPSILNGNWTISVSFYIEKDW
jgi:hypothetical protein